MIFRDCVLIATCVCNSTESATIHDADARKVLAILVTFALVMTLGALVPFLMGDDCWKGPHYQ